MKRLATSRSSYVLVTLGVMFTVGAAVRFLPGNTAVAAETTADGHAPAGDAHGPAPAETAAKKAETPPAPIDQVCFSAETAALLAQDQEKIKAQLADLNDRELSVQAREQEIARRTADLEAMKDSMDQRWSEMFDASNEDLDHLAKMYSTMKPDQAAGIFNQMEPDFAAGFMRLMKSEQAGLILAAMDPRKAYQVSLQLAEKNEDVRASSAP